MSGFYLVAMIFIIFDIEVVFLYPFAVMFHQLSEFGFVEIVANVRPRRVHSFRVPGLPGRA